MNNRVVVGSEEWLGLPELGIPAIKARVDSGAKTSSLHAYNIRGFKRGTVAWVSFELHPIQHDRRTIVRCECEVLDKRLVKSSTGIAEKRYVIRTRLHLGRQRWDIEVTLTNRDSMGYRMLLGREAMHERILVDPSASFLCGTHSEDEVARQYGSTSPATEGLDIGLLATNPDLYSNQRIIEAAKNRGHRIRFYDISQCRIRLHAEKPEVHYREGQILNNLDAIIPRIRPGLTSYGCALVRQFESFGVYSLNSAAAIANSRDKLLSLQVLLKSGLDIPRSGIARSSSKTAELMDLVKSPPLMIRLLQDSTEQGVITANTRKAAESAIKAFRSIDGNLIVQEQVKEARNRSLRLLVVNRKVVAAMQREESVGNGKGSAPSPVKTSVNERRLAVKAAGALGLKVAGVDMIRSRKGPLLLDVNSSPALEDLEEISGVDIAIRLIRAIERKLGWRLPPAGVNPARAPASRRKA